jgi:acetoacetyl-CoA synthetase
MNVVEEGTLLWEPSEKVVANANLTHYMAWLVRERGLRFAGYDALWSWSVNHVAAFWESIWDYFDVTASAEPEAISAQRGDARR